MENHVKDYGRSAASKHPDKDENEILVFVYGSLKRGFQNYYGLLDGHIGTSEFLFEGKTKGEMYDLGAFPAVNVNGEGEVHGEVFKVDRRVLRALDRLEGYPSFYNRSKVKVESKEDDRKVKAFIYHIPKQRITSKIRVPGGNWKMQTN